MSALLSKTKFIEAANEIHDNKFDYSLLPDYFKRSDKISIICPVHGVFEQIARDHIASGHGCKKCRIPSAMTTDELMTIHADKFDGFELVSRSGNTLTVKCCHGITNISISEFLRGRTKCKKCADIKRSKPRFDFASFVIEANTTHYGKYRYYNEFDKQGRMKMWCPMHGIFWQRPRPHHILHKQGCPSCGKQKQSDTAIENYGTMFAERAAKIHGNRYDYSLVKYAGSDNYVTIICPIHGEFRQLANNHLQGRGCRKCANAKSKPEEVLSEMLDSTFVQADRTLIAPLELDFVSHEHKLAIEVNGSYWHSSKFKEPTYHLDKTNQAEAKGYQLLHFWDFEIIDKPELVKSMIAAKIGKNVRVFARKCQVDTITAKQARLFEEENHLQGAASSESVRYGLVHNNELVALMTFGKSRFDKKYDWELIRYCCLKGHTVVGGASKLFKHFLKNHSGSVMSYANRRISDGGLYKKLGFNEVTRTGPNYFWISNKIRYSRQQCQKHKLSKLLGDKYSERETEVENMTRNGFVQCFDSGNIKYEFLRM